MEDIATITPLACPWCGVAPVCRLLSGTVFTTAGGGAETGHYPNHVWIFSISRHVASSEFHYQFKH